MNASTFLARTERDAETGCWNWVGQADNGYCRVMINRCRFLVHRFSYELFVGPIPPGLVIDHLCRNRRCVNPGHLEVVTQRENIRRGESPIAENFRKTHCPHGHEFDESNTRVGVHGRVCRACNRIQVRAAYRRKREQREAA